LTLEKITETFQQLIPTVATFNTLLVVLAAVAMYFIINAVIGLIVPRLARALTILSDKADNTDKVHQFRRLDTLLGTGAAVVRTAVLCMLIYMVWLVVMPQSAPIALIGASAFFAILAGNTVGTLLKDVTAGSMMIAERWYNVGDYVYIEPFGSSGVVEQLTPRATKLRALTGEAIWLHNQHIQGVRVTSRGVRTMALDVFVRDLGAGKRTIEQAIRTIPTGPTMVAKQLDIRETEELGDGLWRITAIGQTMPGREWLIEDFAVKAINKYDGLRDGDPVIVHGPISRHVDATAERRFKRAVSARA
jgi:hypothetical protein